MEWRPDGRLLLTLKNVWKDGTHALTLEPHDLLVRLCAAIPPPWFNMVRYFGVFSSHSKHRSRVVPAPAELEPGRSCFGFPATRAPGEPVAKPPPGLRRENR